MLYDWAQSYPSEMAREYLGKSRSGYLTLTRPQVSMKSQVHSGLPRAATAPKTLSRSQDVFTLKLLRNSRKGFSQYLVIWLWLFSPQHLIPSLVNEHKAHAWVLAACCHVSKVTKFSDILGQQNIWLDSLHPGSLKNGVPLKPHEILLCHLSTPSSTHEMPLQCSHPLGHHLNSRAENVPVC